MPRYRDEHGRFTSTPMSTVRKQKISKAQIERHRRQRAQQGPPPDHKRCSKCNKVKRVPEDYYMRKRKLASGEIGVYPAGECKVCSRARADAWRDSMTEEERKRKQAEYNQARIDKDPDEFRRKQRDWSRDARIRAGVKPRGPWKRYREQESQILVDADPFTEYCRERKLGPMALQHLTGIDESFFRHKRKQIELRIVDLVMTANGDHDQVSVLYPPQKLAA